MCSNILWITIKMEDCAKKDGAKRNVINNHYIYLFLVVKVNIYHITQTQCKPIIC